jgi:Amt family ammonium transporter
MKRLAFAVCLLGALWWHFNTGIWAPDASGGDKTEVKKEDQKEDKKDAKDEKAADKKDAPSKEEEKKPAEEKKPSPDKTGANTKDTSAVSGTKDLTKETFNPESVNTNINAVIDAVGKNRSGINMMWTLITGFLVFFMQAGFALVETGLTRYKNVAHTMAMNLMIYAIGVLGFFFVGYALMYGGSATSWFGSDPNLLTSEFYPDGGKKFGLFGMDGFMLTGRAFDVSVMAIFLFQMVFMDTAATIPTGALAERWKFLSFCIYGFAVSMIIYPIYGNWVWGGGWLSKLGANFGLGHGHVDFAGSSVVHMTGGFMALAGVMVLGPRLGKYNKDGSVNVIPAHSVPMYMLGTLILAFGWFGFNPGSTNAGADLNIARIAVNTMLASAAGAFASMVYMWCVYGKPDPSFMCNGMLAGLVAITAPCAFVTPPSAVLIGAIAGVIVVWSCFFWERTAKIDDPVGAISVHGVCGAWGILALGLLADGSYGQGFNNTYWFKVNETKLEWSPVALEGATAKEALEAIDAANKDKEPKDKIEAPAFLKALAPDAKLEAQGVTGLLYGSSSQFVASCVGVLMNIVWVFGISFLFFWIVEKAVGNRVSPQTELQGLDVPELGAPGYINEDPKTPEGHLTSAATDPKPAVQPPDGKRRFTIVLEGLKPDQISSTWSELCKPQAKPSGDFISLYSKMTTLQGNRFRFRDGVPDQVSAQLVRLFQEHGGPGVKGFVEKS